MSSWYVLVEALTSYFVSDLETSSSTLATGFIWANPSVWYWYVVSCKVEALQVGDSDSIPEQWTPRHDPVEEPWNW